MCVCVPAPEKMLRPNYRARRAGTSLDPVMSPVMPRGTAFRFFYGSFVASILGDAFRLLAVNVWIFEATEGSTTDRLVLILLGNVPGMLLGGVAGVLADRWDRFRILLTSAILRFVVGIGLPGCAVLPLPYAALGLIA